MKNIKNELENEFAKLSELKNVGLALADLAQSRFHCETYTVDLFGVYGVAHGQITFKFPSNSESFFINFPNRKADEITGGKETSKPFPKSQEMALEDGAGFTKLKISSASQLAQAAVYIDRVHLLHLAGRQTTPEGQELN